MVNCEDMAVIRVDKADGNGLFREVKGYEVIAFPKDIVFVDDPSIDVLNHPAMALLQTRFPGKTVVVRGMFSHINFVSGMEPLFLRVIDNVPPAPSKLSVLVRMALNSGFVDLPIVVDESVEIDMAECVSEVKTEALMFPCRVSGLCADKPVYFLDDSPRLEHDVTLIGCELSKRIFSAVYSKDVPFINVCPMAHIPEDGRKTIIKCCKIKEGHKIEGNTVMVPWGATVPEVAEALKALFFE